MTLSKEQISVLKKQLHDQIKHLPQDQKKEAEEQIENLSDDAIESMLEAQKESQVKIFREIVSGKIPSKKIEENDNAIAVLEIKPISKGHVIILPKNAVESADKIPQEIIKFAESISKTISEKLDAKKVNILSEIKFGECVINLIPIYDKDLTLKDERSSPSEEQLDKILEEIKKERPKIEKKEEPKKEEKKETVKLKRRVP